MGEQVNSEEVWRHDYVSIASLRLWASKLTVRLCEQVNSEEVWRHDYVSIASLRLWVCKLTAKRFGDTITFPSQACGCGRAS